MYYDYSKNEEGVILPPRVFLSDRSELRLVPLFLSKRPLYAGKDGKLYSLFSHGFKQVNGNIICVPHYPTKKKKQHKVCQLTKIYNHMLVHHAVLSAWVCPRPEGMECDHKNGDSLDNRLCNLEWVTHQENMARRAESYNRKGKGFNGQPLGEWGKKMVLQKLKGKKLLQLEIDFENVP